MARGEMLKARRALNEHSFASSSVLGKRKDALWLFTYDLYSVITFELLCNMYRRISKLLKTICDLCQLCNAVHRKSCRVMRDSPFVTFKGSM